MKIGDKSSIVCLQTYVKQGHNSGAAKQPVRDTEVRSVPATRVEISDRAREIFNKAWKIVEATPEIREEMVGHFKRKAEAGVCVVKADQVAEKMLKEFLLDSL